MTKNMTARFLNRAALLLAVAAIAMTAVPVAAEIPDPFSCARPSLAGIYAFGSKGSMRVGNVAPDYAFDNVTINYESNDLEKLIPGIAPDGEYFMIEDDTLPVNTAAATPAATTRCGVRDPKKEGRTAAQTSPHA